jgi:hypothetical protein
MARISDTHLRFRTKDQIVNDLAFVLSAPLAYGTKHAVLADVAWVWTEFDGKYAGRPGRYTGCKFWTQMALMQHRLDRKSRRLRHEHIVPKRIVIDMLLKLERPTPESVREICERFLIGVVVTIEEDAVLNEFRDSMPSEFDDPASPEYRDPWLRYRRCKIEVVPHADDGS